MMMCAALIGRLGALDSNLTISERARPVFPPEGKKTLIRVLYSALGAHDAMLASGQLGAMLQPSALPYVPTGDACGVVEQTDEPSRFASGDLVVFTFVGEPEGALAEFALADTALCAKLPAGLTAAQGAALTTSAVTALQALSKSGAKAGERALVLGAAGGVGTLLVQQAKALGLEVWAVASDTALLERLGADHAVDRSKERFWELPELRECPVDVVFDCVGGKENQHWARCQGVLKGRGAGGRFVAVALDDNDPHVESRWHLVKFACAVVGRLAWRTLSFRAPRYVMLLSEPKAGTMDELMAVVSKHALVPALDPASPFAFTEEGVKAAFALMASRRAHGKVVVQVGMEE
jgi:NADPH:quinone reductase-like Zn-dependent oxidoreductase